MNAFTKGASFYGTFDQTGNVNQWNDLDGTAGSSRGIRGGDQDSPQFVWSSSVNGGSPEPSWRYNNLGFRPAGPVASAVPAIDPNGLSAMLGLIVGGLGLLERRRYGR